MKLYSIICSTRPGRVGPAVARWFHDYVVHHGKFGAQLVDLAEINLPLYDEPHRIESSAGALLDELFRWAQALRPMRG